MAVRDRRKHEVMASFTGLEGDKTTGMESVPQSREDVGRNGIGHTA